MGIISLVNQKDCVVRPYILMTVMWSSTSPNEPVAASGVSALRMRKTKEQKRAEAEERNRLHRETNQFRERLSQLESEVNGAENTLQTLTEALANPELYQDKDRFFETMGSHARPNKKI